MEGTSDLKSTSHYRIYRDGIFPYTPSIFLPKVFNANANAIRYSLKLTSAGT